MNFEQVYNEYRPRVYRLCMGYVADEVQAEDLVQEIFITVWQNLHTLKNEAYAGTWIFRIASNQCLRTVQNTRKKKPALPLPETIHAAHETEERIQTLYRCISELEETDRIIISLVLEDLPQAEIAAVTGFTEGNVRVKIHRIKERLSKKMKANGRL